MVRANLEKSYNWNVSEDREKDYRRGKDGAVWCKYDGASGHKHQTKIQTENKIPVMGDRHEEITRDDS